MLDYEIINDEWIPQVGDKVRIDNLLSIIPNLDIGDIGIIAHINNDTSNDFGILVIFYNDSNVFSIKELELIKKGDNV